MEQDKSGWGDDGDTRDPYQFAEDARRREKGLPRIIRTAQRPVESSGPESPVSAQPLPDMAAEQTSEKPTAIVSPHEAIIRSALRQIFKLNGRERDILRLCGLGFDDAEIALRLEPKSTEGSVRVTLTRINKKLGLQGKLRRPEKRPTLMEIATRHFSQDPVYVKKYGPAAGPR